MFSMSVRLAFCAAVVLLMLASCVTTHADSGPDAVAAYLAEDAKVHGTPPRFENAPIIRAYRGASDRDVEHLRRSVAIVNSFLPEWFQMEYDPTGWKVMHRAEPESGEILVAFISFDIFPPAIKAWMSEDDIGYALVLNENREMIRFNKNVSTIDRAILYIDSDRIAAKKLEPEFVIVHELLHALGRTHPSKRFPNSVMNPKADPNPPSYLYPIDAAVLKAVYWN